jgi:uncharacterized RDD family membrane protein YckC
MTSESPNIVSARQIKTISGRHVMADFNPYQTPNAYVEDVSDGADGELAGRVTRLGAALIDGIIMLPFGLALLFMFFPGIFSGEKPPFPTSLLVGLITSTIWVAINFSLLTRNGQTVGKRLLGIKIARSDRSSCGVWRIVGLRFLIPGFISRIPIFGLLFVLVDLLFIFQKSRRTLHDLLADTIVIQA